MKITFLPKFFGCSFTYPFSILFFFSSYVLLSQFFHFVSIFSFAVSSKGAYIMQVLHISLSLCPSQLFMITLILLSYCMFSDVPLFCEQYLVLNSNSSCRLEDSVLCCCNGHSLCVLDSDVRLT